LSIEAVSWSFGANLIMSVAWPKAFTPRFAAACIAAGESVCWVMMSAPWSIIALAASPSLPGSYQVLMRMNFERIFGLTLRAPRRNAFTPMITSGIGTAPT
jgi:hypothetical protein